jgi:hypothetical protein
MMMTHFLFHRSKTALFRLHFLLVVALSVVADVVKIGNSAVVDDTFGLFSLHGGIIRRVLQDKRQVDDDSLPLYENTLTLATTTPWYEDYLDECLNDNYTYTTNNPDNFIWYGLRIILPDDAGDSGSSWFTNVATTVQDNGFQQAYGEETPVVVFNTTFQTTETNPTIWISINDDALFGTYQFFFDDMKNGEPVETTKSFGAVSCLVERSEDGGEGWMGVLDGVLTISMSQKQLREGTQTSSASLALLSLSLILSTSITVIMML